MRLLFWVATALEWQAACPQYKGPLPEQVLLDFMDEHGQPHLLCITGVGPVNAALAAGLCLGQLATGKHDTPANAANVQAKKFDTVPLRVDAAVNLGVAGSFDLTRAPLGSAWRVTREIYPEYGLASGNDVDARALGFSQWQPATSGNAVWDSVDLPGVGLPTADLPHGNVSSTHGEMLPPPIVASLTSGALCALPTATSLTVAGVTADAARAAHLQARHGALLENMEGFALALACARHRLPLLELRTVSNAVGPRISDPQAGQDVPQHRDFPKALTALQPLLRNLLNLPNLA